MRSTLRPNRISLAAAVWCSLALGAGAQDPGNATAAPSREESQAKLEALLDAFDLTPQPVPEVPDDPPPHEGKMIDSPEYRIEPPDLILIEVLEALPGRPISGERLVRPDGTISLGFYGEVHVRGLTLRQAKVKIIKHLRRFLSDDALGLHDTRQAWASPPAKPARAPAPNRLDAPAENGEKTPFQIDDAAPALQETDEPAWTPMPPELSVRVFVDITAYNSKNYYVLGDVGAPGKLPHTGNETILDALQHAAGLLNSADPNNIRLVRPGRDGKPGKVYPVDLEAIRDRGETATNYQLFPGDRLVIGRDKLVEKTVQVDRLAAAIHNVVASIQRQAEMNQALSKAYSSGDVAALKDAVEFWIREMNRPGGAVLDEDVLRDALLRRLQPKPEEPKDGE